jgi:hypothetical protein
MRAMRSLEIPDLRIRSANKLRNYSSSSFFLTYFFNSDTGSEEPELEGQEFLPIGSFLLDRTNVNIEKSIYIYI